MLRLRRMLRAGALGGGGVAPPATPSGLTATATNSVRIDLAWTDNATDETEQRIYRSTDGVTYALLDTIAADLTAYTDATCEPSTQYWYRVAAANAVGESLSDADDATTPTSYWLTFDGTDDFITLPSGHGQEPSTAITIEAWIKDMSKTTQSQLVCRGNFFNRGYSMTTTPNTGITQSVLCLTIDNGAGSNIAQNVGKLIQNTELPIHVAVSWDATNIYYFVQGVLVATNAVGGTLEYTGTDWLIGAMPGPTWPFGGKLTQLRVSNTCRYTDTFTPPRDFVTDANTIGLWRAQEGAGTSLADASGNNHTGTFKGAGEPAWGAAADLSVASMSYGDNIWTTVLGIVPSVAGTVYLKRVDADTYYVFRQIHADGYWVSWWITRSAGAPLNFYRCYVGQTTTNDPSTWAADPTTILSPAGVKEYVFEGRVLGGSDIQWGNEHGNEVLDSDGWYVDGSLVTLINGQIVSGSSIEYRASTHHSDGATRVCNVTKSLVVNNSQMYLEGSYTFDWLVDWYPTAQLFPVMCSPELTTLTTFTLEPGGTDYTITDYDKNLRAHGAAFWKADENWIFAVHTDYENALRYAATQGAFVSSSTNKLYFVRSLELNRPQAGDVWAYTARWLGLDNCGDHFLKTT